MEDTLAAAVGKARPRMDEVRRDFHDLQAAAFEGSDEPAEDGGSSDVLPPERDFSTAPRSIGSDSFWRIAAGVALAVSIGTAGAAVTDWGWNVLSEARNAVRRGLLGPIEESTGEGQLPPPAPAATLRRVSPTPDAKAALPAAATKGALPPASGPGGACVFAFENSGRVYIINPVDGSLLGSPLELGYPIEPGAVALTKDGTTAILLDPSSLDSKLLTVDIETGAVGSQLSLGAPRQLALAEDDRTAYVFELGETPKISVVSLSDPPSVVREIDLPAYRNVTYTLAPSTQGIVLHPNERHLLLLVRGIVESKRSPLQMVDLRMGVSKDISLPTFPLALSRLSAGRSVQDERLFISGQGGEGGETAVIVDFETMSVVGGLAVGDGMAFAIASSVDQRELYVGQYRKRGVLVFETANLEESLPPIDVGYVLSPMVTVETPLGERLFLQTATALGSGFDGVGAKVVAIDVGRREQIRGGVPTSQSPIVSLIVGGCPHGSGL